VIQTQQAKEQENSRVVLMSEAGQKGAVQEVQEELGGEAEALRFGTQFWEG